jgi:adenylate cyclase
MMPKMKCDGCGFDAPADFSFCPKCGRKLDAATGAIASGPPATPPAAPASEADRRPATILFADLTGFTALSERLDPEDVRALQTDLFDEMRAVLLREDALLEKFVGDAVMAVFGAPAAHEDDPQRALRAALHMHERVAALTQRWTHRLQQPLMLHKNLQERAGHGQTDRRPRLPVAPIRQPCRRLLRSDQPVRHRRLARSRSGD